jgi:hypothetical protein
MWENRGMRAFLKLWLQVRGNAKWDTAKAVCGALMGGGLIAGVWASVKWWLIQPVLSSTLLGVWLICALLLLLLWTMTGRLTLLEPRVEFVSQRPEGTGYKRPGRDIAIVLPFKKSNFMVAFRPIAASSYDGPYRLLHWDGRTY